MPDQLSEDRPRPLRAEDPHIQVVTTARTPEGPPIEISIPYVEGFTPAEWYRVHADALAAVVKVLTQHGILDKR